jgi:hypothetical protein
MLKTESKYVCLLVGESGVGKRVYLSRCETRSGVVHVYPWLPVVKSVVFNVQIGDDSLADCAMIMVDVSKPSDIVPSVHKWMDIIRLTNQTIPIVLLANKIDLLKSESDLVVVERELKIAVKKKKPGKWLEELENDAGIVEKWFYISGKDGCNVESPMSFLHYKILEGDLSDHNNPPSYIN